MNTFGCASENLTAGTVNNRQTGVNSLPTDNSRQFSGAVEGMPPSVLSIFADVAGQMIQHAPGEGMPPSALSIPEPDV
ncbi:MULTISPECIES: hypothetical protein [unclassified Kitasatospora]|uniref:hypothetical protein n=1 Tax=unclassified Kitasatospora TaxID=2633591 RepID=UPI0033C4C355